MSYIVATFYQFIALPDCKEKQKVLQQQCAALGIRGTILLAQEGINATIVGTRSAIDQLRTFLKSDLNFDALEYKESLVECVPFKRLKVKVKREIVTLGQPIANPQRVVGQYIEPQAWNELISQPDVITIDTRNDFEYSIGSFRGATNPHTHSFREFPEFVKQNLDPQQHKRVAMFCTGGIRCEKATSYLRQQGFEAVYHLKGGILKYLETVPETESLWEGECFVFDDRVAVSHGLKTGEHELCMNCGHPVSAADREHPHYEAWVSCPHCHESLTPEKRSRRLERKRQMEAQS